MTKSLYIKNMVCPRCIAAVEQTLSKLNIQFKEVSLGKAIVENDKINFGKLDAELKAIGFELINNTDFVVSEQIKNLIVNIVHYSDNEKLNVNLSDYLSKKIGKSYSLLSKIFSDIEGTTIEKYIILQKIEKVKELITYNDLNFSEIAFKLNYSSAAHLSKQFKEIMGLTLSEYKTSEIKYRKTLDNL